MEKQQQFEVALANLDRFCVAIENSSKVSLSSEFPSGQSFQRKLQCHVKRT